MKSEDIIKELQEKISKMEIAFSDCDLEISALKDENKELVERLKFAESLLKKYADNE